MNIPSATYRLQLSRNLPFKKVKEIMPYLLELGISHVYASPIFKARKGSLHGYDIVDPRRINHEIGSLDEFEKVTAQLKGHGIGWLQDIVPNHMAFDAENEMLMDVLENGPRSNFFNYFDIAWDHPYTSMKGRLLAPFLGRFHGEAIEEGEIRIRYGQEGFKVIYYDVSFPLRIESYIHLLTHRLEELKNKLGGNHPDFIKLLGVLYVLKTLPSQEDGEEGYDQVMFVKRTLWEIYTKNEAVRRFIDGNLNDFNGERVRLLDHLLAEQLYRLSFWKVATEEINYRRFFTVNDLICLRMEEEDVFHHTHALILKLLRDGRITGLRIDHIDGLFDPKIYLERVRREGIDIYIVVEKILTLNEELPLSWPVQGTTGYDFLNYLNRLFCKGQNEKPFDRVYASFTGFKDTFDDLVTEKKRLILGKHMAGDVDNLAHQLKDISSRDRYGSDITLYGLKRALVEVMASFPVYRTFLSKEDSRAADRTYINEAVEKAKERQPGLRYELDFVERFLLTPWRDDLSQEERSQRLAFIMRFQQFTGPLMAKGFEDTVLYVYNRLISLNEVGGSPGLFGISLNRFHNLNSGRMNHWPHSLSATSTHDAKRGEDVRARLNVLSELPHEWEDRLKTWSRLNKKIKKKVRGLEVPDRNDEYFLYQTLIGAFPFHKEHLLEFGDRIKKYILKAVREAKVHTAWLKPDAEYENAYLSFLDEILIPGNPFLEAFIPFLTKVAHFGIFNSLSQTLIKMTSPGVPDFYQGSELWDLNLVDPDNRRPVDFMRREAILRGIKRRAETDTSDLIRELLSTREDGRIKLFLIHRVLAARRERSHLFREGVYLPIEPVGSYKEHIVAYARRRESDWAVTVAPRFLTALVSEGEDPLGEERWKGTGLVLPEEAPERWVDAVTGRDIKRGKDLAVGEILKFFPAALLISATRGTSS
jgi:(1->4)-alpha-D-glucan 1-alpha-D-glucosylmutase